MSRVMTAGLIVCWGLLVVLGHAMPLRLFAVALGATVTVSTYVAVRGPAWYAAYRVGREVQAAKSASEPSRHPARP